MVAPLSPGAIPKVGARLGRIMTRKGSNADAGEVATMWPRSSIREKESREKPGSVERAYVCAYHPGTATSGAATADVA